MLCTVGGDTHRPKAASCSHVLGKLLNVDEIELLLRGLTGGETPRLRQHLSKEGVLETSAKLNGEVICIIMKQTCTHLFEEG